MGVLTEWWIWVAIGIVLISLEVTTGDFLLLGLGVGTIGVGIIEKYLNLDFKADLILWIVISVLYFYIWKKFIHSKIEGAKVGRPDYAIGEVGLVIDDIKDLKPGKVKFEPPVMGNRIWVAVSDQEIPKGKKVKIIDILGQYIKVAPIEGE